MVPRAQDRAGRRGRATDDRSRRDRAGNGRSVLSANTNAGRGGQASNGRGGRATDDRSVLSANTNPLRGGRATNDRSVLSANTNAGVNTESYRYTNTTTNNSRGGYQPYADRRYLYRRGRFMPDMLANAIAPPVSALSLPFRAAPNRRNANTPTRGALEGGAGRGNRGNNTRGVRVVINNRPTRGNTAIAPAETDTTNNAQAVITSTPFDSSNARGRGSNSPPEMIANTFAPFDYMVQGREHQYGPRRIVSARVPTTPQPTTPTTGRVTMPSNLASSPPVASPPTPTPRHVAVHPLDTSSTSNSKIDKMVSNKKLRSIFKGKSIPRPRRTA